MPSDHGRMTGLATCAGQNSGRTVHPVNIFRTGLSTNQNDRLAKLGSFDRFMRGESQLTNGSAW